MKLSDGFDARRLRNKHVTDWRWRLVCLCIALFGLTGLAFATLGGLALLANLPQLEELHDSPIAATSLLLCGLLLICSSLLIRRRSRRRFQNGSLSLAPHLLRK
jgi:hypothetical protein